MRPLRVGPGVSVALTTWLPHFPMVKGWTVDMNRGSYTCLSFHRIVDGSNNNCQVGPDYESSDDQSVDCPSVAVSS